MLISILLIGYLYFFSDPIPQEEGQTQTETEQVEQSEESADQKTESVSPTKEPEEELVSVDSANPFFDLLHGEEKTLSIENKELIVEFSTRGGSIKKVTLKNHKTYKKETLVLLDEGSSKMSMMGSSSSSPLLDNSGVYDLYGFYYEGKTGSEIQGEDTLNYILFTADHKGGKIQQKYSLRNGSFELEYNLDPGPLSSNEKELLTFQWRNDHKRFEKTMDQSRNQTSVNYYDRNEDVVSVSNDNDPEEESEQASGIKWFSLKQRFFNAGFISPSYMGKGIFSSQFDPADSSIIKTQQADVQIPGKLLGMDKDPFRFYLGPNNYQVLKKVDNGYGENVYLGWTIFASVNKYTVVPFFNFLERYISNYGLLIFILVLVVKLILFPLSYKSYTGMAKMKVLKPEIEEIKERIGDDQQKVQMETMKLYQQFGVNPLAGCIPVALQIPVLFALFNFFPNSIELRQQSFLWADDLSTYDSILDLPFNIPFYGDHVSLFTLLMTVSTIAYTYVQNQNNPMQQQGPMKTMQYFFPIMIMFFLNNFSAGLTYYYFLSNIVTIVQQFVIRKFTDDSDIRAKLEQKHQRKKTKKKSKFQQKMENAMTEKVEGQNRAMRRQLGKK